MANGGSGMDGNQIFTVNPKLLVNKETIFRNHSSSFLVIIRFDNAWNRSGEEWQSLSSEITHGNTRSRHDGHESIQTVMTNVCEKVLYTGSTRKILNLVLFYEEKEKCIMSNSIWYCDWSMLLGLVVLLTADRLTIRYAKRGATMIPVKVPKDLWRHIHFPFSPLGEFCACKTDPMQPIMVIPLIQWRLDAVAV